MYSTSKCAIQWMIAYMIRNANEDVEDTLSYFAASIRRSGRLTLHVMVIKDFKLHKVCRGSGGSTKITTHQVLTVLPLHCTIRVQVQ